MLAVTFTFVYAPDSIEPAIMTSHVWRKLPSRRRTCLSHHNDCRTPFCSMQYESSITIKTDPAGCAECCSGMLLHVAIFLPSCKAVRAVNLSSEALYHVMYDWTTAAAGCR